MKNVLSLPRGLSFVNKHATYISFWTVWPVKQFLSLLFDDFRRDVALEVSYLHQVLSHFVASLMHGLEFPI